MSVQERIEQLVIGNEVVLFMKGTRAAPQCGFSASVVAILDDYLKEYVTVDVLSEGDVREGVKQYSKWPTLPQLYVSGRFVGGSDIVKEMRESGELSQLLGAKPRETTVPEISVTDRAAEALLRFAEGKGKPTVRLEIDPDYRNGLAFDAPTARDLVIELAPFTLVMDSATARRADGLEVDWIETPDGGGFKIKNPNEPPSVRQLSVIELKEMLDAGKPLWLFDVRTPEERELAKFDDSTLLDADGKAQLDALDRDTALVLYCHHGIRSQVAAEHCLRMGFREVYNLAGGLEAWADQVDPSFPRY